MVEAKMMGAREQRRQKQRAIREEHPNTLNGMAIAGSYQKALV
jgi:hypothetical protein